MLAAAKSGRGRSNAWARLKAQTDAVVKAYALSVGLLPMAGTVDVSCEWFENTARRDTDNVSAAIKSVLDGLVDAGVLTGDTQKHIGEIRHRVTHHRFTQPGVQVTLVSSDD